MIHIERYCEQLISFFPPQPNRVYGLLMVRLFYLNRRGEPPTDYILIDKKQKYT
jgi:hypothetical protein